MTDNPNLTFLTASTPEALAIAVHNNPLLEPLLSRINEPEMLPLVVQSFGLASAIAKLAPDLIDKADLRVHIHINDGEHKAVDQLRWYQLASDLLKRPNPIELTANFTDDTPSSYADQIGHVLPGVAIPDIAPFIEGGPAPDIIFVPGCTVPDGEKDLPSFNWIQAAVARGTVVLGWTHTALEQRILLQSFSGSGLRFDSASSSHPLFSTDTPVGPAFVGERLFAFSKDAAATDGRHHEDAAREAALYGALFRQSVREGRATPYAGLVQTYDELVIAVGANDIGLDLKEGRLLRITSTLEDDSLSLNFSEVGRVSGWEKPNNLETGLGLFRAVDEAVAWLPDRGAPAKTLH